MVVPTTVAPLVRKSLAFLVIALVLFLCGHWGAVPMLASRSLGTADYSWWVAFSAIWIGDIGALLFELLSVAYAIPLVRRVLYSRDPLKRGEMETLLPIVKSIGAWNCCLPVVGVLPPVPLLLLIGWFELWICAWLEGSLSLNIMVVFIPMLIVETLGLCHFLFIATHSTFSGICVLSLMAFTVLLPLKVDGAVDMSWSVAFAPLFTMETVAILVCLYIIVHHVTEGGRIRLSSLQIVALLMFFASLLLQLAAAVLLCLHLMDANSASDEPLKPSSDEVWVAVGLFMGAGVLFVIPVAAICWNHVEQCISHGIEVPKRLGAGWEIDAGLETWLCLGHVALKPGNNEHWKELASCSMMSCTNAPLDTSGDFSHVDDDFDLPNETSSFLDESNNANRKNI